VRDASFVQRGVIGEKLDQRVCVPVFVQLGKGGDEFLCDVCHRP
jgi:hypothetical protein